MKREDPKKNYDVILLPTGETSYGDRTFPVSKEVIKLYKEGRFGVVYVTGGHDGFAKGGPGLAESEAQDTVGFLKENGIDEGKIYLDHRPLESVGKLTFPLLKPLYPNPALDEFESILVVGKKGQLWRIRDYADVVMPMKTKVDFHPIAGGDGLATKLYHLAIMNKISDKNGNDVHDFLMGTHPFYSKDWYKKNLLIRKTEMGLTGLIWLAPMNFSGK